MNMDYQESCTRCGRVFESDSEWSARYARDEHYKYCSLPQVHKVMQVLLAPLGIVALCVFIVGTLLSFILAPVAYLFVYAASLLLENEVYPWVKFEEQVYGFPGRVKTSKGKPK